MLAFTTIQKLTCKGNTKNTVFIRVTYANRKSRIVIIDKHTGQYSKSSLTLSLNEWRFYLSFSCVSLRFLNSWRVNIGS